MAGFAQTFGEDPDARRVHAVVVADQYPHVAFHAAPCHESGRHDSGCTHPAGPARVIWTAWAGATTGTRLPTTTARCSGTRSARFGGCLTWRKRPACRARPRARSWPAAPTPRPAGGP